ncbi:Metacaspase-3 [Dactylella cylindrospora]|nr:Metacaspase-3 [Dactylella cylindrospora]
MDQRPEIWALLIGVDHYILGNKGNVWYQDLKGCVRDVEALKRYLMKRGVPEENIRLLTSRNGYSALAEEKENLPVYGNVERELNHLIENARDGLVYIHFSGHGIQREVLPLDENGEGDTITGTALALADAMTGGQYLTGYQLGEFVKTMVQQNNLRTTVVMDSCFSGRGVRHSENKVDTIRQGEIRSEIGSDKGVLISDDGFLLEHGNAADSQDISGDRNAMRRMSWLSDPNAAGCTVLTACDFNETAGERTFGRDGTHGILTYWLLNSLNASNGRPTYSVIKDTISQNIRRMIPRKIQSPVLHGDGHFRFLEDEMVVERPAAHSLNQENSGYLDLDVGWAQGVAVGAVYEADLENQDPESDIDASTVPPLFFRIVSVPSPFRSTAQRLKCPTYTHSAIKAGARMLLQRWALPKRTVIKISMSRKETLGQRTRTETFRNILSKTHNLCLQDDGDNTTPTYSIFINKERKFEIYEGRLRLPRVPEISADDGNWPGKLGYLIRHLSRFRAMQKLKDDWLNSNDRGRLNPSSFLFEVEPYSADDFVDKRRGIYRVEAETYVRFKFTLLDNSIPNTINCSFYVFGASWNIEKQNTETGQAYWRVGKGKPEGFDVKMKIPPKARARGDPDEIEDTVRAFVCTSDASWEEIGLPDLPCDPKLLPANHNDPMPISKQRAFDEQNRDVERVLPSTSTRDRPQWAIVDIKINTRPRTKGRSSVAGSRSHELHSLIEFPNYNVSFYAFWFSIWIFGFCLLLMFSWNTLNL